MQDLLKLLKVSNQNLQILHRNVASSNWFPTHEKLGEYYDKVQLILDDLCEMNLALGNKEPLMSESLKSYDELEITERNEKESFNLVIEMFNNIVIEINRVLEKEIPDDFKNKLQEYQEYFRKEAEYKLTRATK